MKEPLVTDAYQREDEDQGVFQDWFGAIMFFLCPILLLVFLLWGFIEISNKPRLDQLEAKCECGRTVRFGQQ